MRWLKLTIAYDGGAYAGWQVQPDKPTVQGAVEAAWREITQETLRLTAAGRTDAGVHAVGQVAGVATESRLTIDILHRGLNAVLPDDIAILSVEAAREGFHATHDAVGKLYRYQIHNGRVASVFDRHFSWHYPRPLDAAAMHGAGQALVGKHDFSSFESAGSERPDSIRTIHALTVTRDEGVGSFWQLEGRGGRDAFATGKLNDRGWFLVAKESRPLPRDADVTADRITIEVAGDGFLYNMVRSIVGTLVEVGRGRRELDWPREVLGACDRRRAGQTVPPQGLFLVRVDY